jgi:predicted dinucleotide-binding enzyme
MRFTLLASLTIAVIGDGSLGWRLASAFVRAGHRVMLAGKADAAVVKSEAIKRVTIAEAANKSDIVFIAAPPESIREIAYWLGHVQDRVIVDLSAIYQSIGSEPIDTVAAITTITGLADVVRVSPATTNVALKGWPVNGKDCQLTVAGNTTKSVEIVKMMLMELGIDRISEQLADKMPNPKEQTLSGSHGSSRTQFTLY